MHPFGGTPICPRCRKAVYAAEQIMGPGRKLYHKPCLSCTSCRKRLDSYSLVEHDQDPYCKTCHVKNFGTRDLRHANLPDRDDVLLSPPTSPLRAANSLPQTSPRTTAPPLPARKTPPGGAPAPLFKPTHSWSPKRTSFSAPMKPPSPVSPEDDAPKTVDVDTERKTSDEDDWEPPAISGAPAHAGRGPNGLPRTVPLAPSMAGPPATPARSTPPAMPPRPTPSATPVRAGTLSARVALTPTSTGRQFGGSNPVCGRCGKTVYFAEQVKAVGKTFHRACLRCSACNTTLDSARLTERDGDPYCKHCYGKLHGPAGNGYALLGKAGG